MKAGRIIAIVLGALLALPALGVGALAFCFQIPFFDRWFSTVDEGILAMKEEAGKTGATGVINVLCMDAKGYKDGSVLCYGDAVKFN